MTTHTPEHPLEIRAGDLSAKYITDTVNGAKIASVYVRPVADDLIKRYNVHPAMLEALRAVVEHAEWREKIEGKGSTWAVGDRAPLPKVRAAIAAAESQE